MDFIFFEFVLKNIKLVIYISKNVHALLFIQFMIHQAYMNFLHTFVNIHEYEYGESWICMNLNVMNFWIGMNYEVMHMNIK